MSAKGKALQDAILEVCRKHGKAIPDSVLATELPNSTVENRALAYNDLLKSVRLQIFLSAPDAEPTYKAMHQEDTLKFKGLSADDMLVVQVITNAGNTGIWTRDMKQRTNLPQAKIGKTLKLLEERGLVKAVKSVQHASRKVYMLATLEPGKELTGGPWYGQDQQPDQEFIETIRKVARGYVEKAKAVTLGQVVDYIMESGISNTVLGTEDVKTIMKTLEYDHFIEEFVDPATGSNEHKFRPLPDIVPQRARFTDIPCGVCPVFADCHEGGRVSPQTCQYYTEWLADLEF